jgi:pimeloyl-ACP methyl ester carboxylesterase
MNSMKQLPLIFFLFLSMMATAQQIKTGYKTVNGLRMYYEIHGSGYPLILIHGGGSTIGTTFGRILPQLAATSMVIAVEMQAHGHTSDIDRLLSFEQDADDVSALMEALNIDKADLLGFSNGGSTVMQMAIRYQKKVRKAIVCSSFFKRDGIYPQVWDFIEGGTVEIMPKELKEAYLTINPDPKALKVMHDRDRQRMIDFKDWDEKDIKAIQAETLLVIGDKDVVKPEHTIEMYRLIRNCKLLVIPGSHGEYLGEITTYKDTSILPSVFVELVKDFLK